MTTTDLTTTDMTMLDEHARPDDDFDELLPVTHGHAAPDMHPRLVNMSESFMYRAVVRAETPAPPEYVTVSLPRSVMEDPRTTVAVSNWNLLWEAAQYRRRFFDEDDLPAPMYKIADRGDLNVVFV